MTLLRLDEGRYPKTLGQNAFLVDVNSYAFAAHIFFRKAQLLRH
jgi:hypothetical protein